MRLFHIGALALAVSAVTLGAAGCSADRTTAAPAAAQAGRGAPAAAQAAEGAPAKAVEGAPAAETVVLGSGRDRTASRTAADWKTYADHVLVVTVAGETRVEPSRLEVERGEGMIGRTVQLRIDKVLWSAPDAPQKAPATLKVAAAGWVFNNNEGKAAGVKFAMEDSSRLEVGHTYVKAVEWVDDACSADPAVGTWEGLGSGDTIPYDKGVVGAGEFEGRTQTLDQAKAKFGAGESTLRPQLAGGPVDTLVSNLKAAPARAETDHGSRECDPADK
ncbi:hypothetical protein GCM10010435_90890 [Winogradskya consettensis]|uniref:Lipoprotein n=1 Tax=Winogradskya consettensis TaxID=113560 RepID=A0A919SKC8_9ACTN|nr:hypothetical protein [Actinoplanes consettensis]GIM73281.1 hypothetical protein Aco04nite_34460 [Actinoplanes consettensis]